jgi:exportin-1
LLLQRESADHVLTLFRDLPEAWTRVDAILEATRSALLKFYALQVLQHTITYRWKSLPKEQREGIRTYVVQKVIAWSSDEAFCAGGGSALVQKINLVLVSILKYDWPQDWPSFIPDLAGSSQTSELLCENNVRILRLLSEEVFDFSKDSMTSARAQGLKQSLTGQFQQIFELFSFVLNFGSRPSLVRETLDTLLRYVTWIPEQYIFRTPLLQTLCEKFLHQKAYKNAALKVLTEVAALSVPAHNDVFVQLYASVLNQLVRLVPAEANLNQLYQSGSASDQEFILNLALFLSSFFREHVGLLETELLVPYMQAGMRYLVGASAVEDPEVFKICLEYWQRFSADLYGVVTTYNPYLRATGVTDDGQYQPMLGPTSTVSPIVAPGAVSGGPQNKELYAEVLTRVRDIIISRMAKPEEVLIEKNDAGDIVRETTKDTDNLAQYKVMRETLVFLTRLDPADTERIIIEKLAKQVDGSEWGWDPLNTLCWAVGSISGTMAVQDEKRFLVAIIKELLALCEAKRGKNNKAVVASNIMYVVGQYPRFLRAHWKFLRTVVLKLFEFMHERHPGVQDMAVDTFLKITTSCRKEFVKKQLMDATPFVNELCQSMLPSVISDLEAHQVQTFYEAVGEMIAAHPDPVARTWLTGQLLQIPNAIWQKTMASASASIGLLHAPDTMRELQRVLRCNTAACKSIGASFASQLASLYLDMLNLFRAYSSFINQQITAGGPNAFTTTIVKLARGVNAEILVLIGTFVRLNDNATLFMSQFLTPLAGPVLQEYADAVHPSAREPEILNLFTEIVNKLQEQAESVVPQLLGKVFEPTVAMITANISDYPEHRLNFFRLLQAINRHCFSAIFSMPPALQKLVVDAVCWAFKHTDRDVGETGLTILEELLENFARRGREQMQAFFGMFSLQLIQDILQVLTDRLHKAHFKLHCAILHMLLAAVASGEISVPLWESPFAVSSGAAMSYQQSLQAAVAAGQIVQGPSNESFIRDFVGKLITAAFPNLKPAQVRGFVDGCLDLSKDRKAYKIHLRDFLIEILEFKEDTPGDSLFAEEQQAAAQAAAAAEAARRAQVPGLQNPYEALPAHYETAPGGDDDL